MRSKHAIKIYAFAIASSFLFANPAISHPESMPGWSKWYPFELANCFYVGDSGETPPYLNCNFINGKVSFIFKDEHISLSAPFRIDHLNRKKEEREVIPEPSSERTYLSAIKKRYGYYYKKSEHSIKQYDKATREWVDIFKTQNIFSEFEILSNGDIMLLCSGYPEKYSAIRPGLWMILQRFDYNLVNFIEIYHRGENSNKPYLVHNLPSEIINTCKLVKEVPVFDRIVPFDDKFILVNSFLGLMYSFDLATNKVYKLDTPWLSMNIPFLESKLRLTNLMVKNTGTLIVARENFPFSISIYPKNSVSATLIVRMNNHFSPGYSKAKNHEESTKGNHFIMDSPEYTKEEVARGVDTLIFELDLVKVQIKSSPISLNVGPILSHLVSSMWLDPTGQWTPLENERKQEKPDNFKLNLNNGLTTVPTVKIK